MTAEETLQLLAGVAHDKLGDRPEVLDLRGMVDYTDYFLIVSAGSHRQVAALADAMIEALHAARVRPDHVEGTEAGEWVLIDAGDVVAHIFLGDRRVFYDLEGLWRDARRVPVAASAGGALSP